MSIHVIVPSYRRPDAAQEILESFMDTKSLRTTSLSFAVDEDDPTLLEYPVHITDEVDPVGGMQGAINQAWPTYAADKSILGFVGDDMRFRTPDWDVVVEETLKDGGVAYGDDGSNNASIELPSYWFVNTHIVEALDYLANPMCNHFFLDDSWRALGKAANCFYYMPDVLIEHLHFSFGKSEKDETYEHSMRVGSGDETRYKIWRWGMRYQQDVASVRQAIAK